jgi:hypothetical protein
VGGQVFFDWAYQIDGGNGELRARPVAPAGAVRLNPAAGLAAPARFLTPVPTQEG